MLIHNLKGTKCYLTKFGSNILVRDTNEVNNITLRPQGLSIKIGVNKHEWYNECDVLII
jgi:hypothetical protein